jgi:hypothetical protein
MRNLFAFILPALICACSPAPTAFQRCYHGLPLEQVVAVVAEDTPENVADKAECTSKWLRNAYAEAEAQGQANLQHLRAMVTAYDDAVSAGDLMRMVETSALAQCAFEGDSPQ